MIRRTETESVRVPKAFVIVFKTGKKKDDKNNNNNNNNNNNKDNMGMKRYR
jgi:hypothetical protein